VKIALNVVQQGPLHGNIDWWQMADRAGIDTIAIPDSPALLRELYVTCAMCADRTEHVTIMTGVTNPASRDPSVTAAALFTLDEIAPGRIALGIGTGDSAMWGVGKRPAKLARLREYVLAVQRLLQGEPASYDGRTFEARWSARRNPVRIPTILAVSGPRALRLGCEIADGMLLSMGFGSDNISYVQRLVREGTDEFGRDPAVLDLWWNTEMVLGPSVEAARSTRLGVATEWLTMGSTEGKQIPDDHLDALVQFNFDIHEISSQYQMEGREQALIRRAKDLGIYDWLLTRSAGFFGTPADIATRLNEYEAKGLDKWMFYVGRDEATRADEVRQICEGVMPRLSVASV
jgi:5,10-methylenetetrahydromethanopterin reductase